ncbi:TetR family transcriptional regulator C-terminal domain-containing protein [Pseudomonas entomophila]|uniref:TetR family transcriptional regulator C-terminal domain-containing protein n=1 Tax=Pseudomonas entomophila TaxID=312306 RepID=UPI0023D8A31A|nr:TetR family transcriptional regulator C-terminal domain-containing protein [Pseudomonas entomophila]MDF0732919.1 TetR family transcriptional regulator C-terminal domain-containing protein [Pseudomonas entomophila]
MPSIREHNVQRIVAAACREFAHRGFALARIDEVAARAGLPKANVHYYFKTKRKLYVAVLETAMGPLAQACELLDPTLSAVCALRRHIRAHAELCKVQPHAMRVLLVELLHGARHLPKGLAERLRQTTRQGRDCLQAWMNQGQIARGSAEHLLLFIWSTTLAQARFAPPPCPEDPAWPVDERGLQAMVRMVCRMVLGGVEAQETSVNGSPLAGAAVRRSDLPRDGADRVDIV